MKKLTNSLRWSLFVQLLMYGLYIFILYRSFSSEVSDFSGLAALIPGGIFIILGFINLLILIFYLYRCYKSKTKPDTYVLVFGLACILCVLYYEKAANWLEWVELSN